MLLHVAPTAASSDTPGPSLATRVDAVRAALREIGGSDALAPPDKLAQWYNWPNWNNWYNWPNWGNWNNWSNWGNWFNR